LTEAQVSLTVVFAVQFVCSLLLPLVHIPAPCPHTQYVKIYCSTFSSHLCLCVWKLPLSSTVLFTVRFSSLCSTLMLDFIDAIVFGGQHKVYKCHTTGFCKMLVTRFSKRRKSDHGYVITPSDIYMERRHSLKGRMIRV